MAVAQAHHRISGLSISLLSLTTTLLWHQAGHWWRQASPVRLGSIPLPCATLTTAHLSHAPPPTHPARLLLLPACLPTLPTSPAGMVCWLLDHGTSSAFFVHFFAHTRLTATQRRAWTRRSAASAAPALLSYAHCGSRPRHRATTPYYDISTPPPSHVTAPLRRRYISAHTTATRADIFSSAPHRTLLGHRSYLNGRASRRLTRITSSPVASGGQHTLYSCCLPPERSAEFLYAATRRDARARAASVPACRTPTNTPTSACLFR